MSNANPIPTTLRNHWNDEVAFCVKPIGIDCLNRPHRLPTYTIVWVREGQGGLLSDHSCYFLNGGAMLFFAPFQPFTLRCETQLEGTMYHFSNEFFCLENHRHEVACNGVLFDNLYAPPCLAVAQEEMSVFDDLTRKMLEAFASPHNFAREDILQSYLKIYLVHASRIYLAQAEIKAMATTEPPVLQQFKSHIEQHYVDKHAPSDYAEMLHLTLKALGKLTKKHFGKTPGELITEKLVIEAKRLLYLTEKSVKEIAHELGFDDQHYFSRFFKKNVSIPAEEYRRRVGTVAELYG